MNFTMAIFTVFANNAVKCDDDVSSVNSTQPINCGNIGHGNHENSSLSSFNEFLLLLVIGYMAGLLVWVLSAAKCTCSPVFDVFFGVLARCRRFMFRTSSAPAAKVCPSSSDMHRAETVEVIPNTMLAKERCEKKDANLQETSLSKTGTQYLKY